MRQFEKFRRKISGSQGNVIGCNPLENTMETQHLLKSVPDPILDSPVTTVASSVLQNVFGGQPAGRTDHVVFPAPLPSIDGMTEDTILGRLESRKEQAAIALGIAAEEVQGLPFDLSALESEGIFLNIDCRGFGALVRQLEWKTLGVKLPENAAIRVSPPRAGLLPDIFRNKLMRGPAQAHAALHKYGFRFTLCETVWGTSDYKWIPWNAFGQFEQDYNRACETLEAAKAEVLRKIRRDPRNAC